MRRRRMSKKSSRRNFSKHAKPHGKNATSLRRGGFRL